MATLDRSVWAAGLGFCCYGVRVGVRVSRAEGLEWLPDETVLTDDEIVRLIDIGVHLLGIREVRFTGGEPLVRRGLVDIVAGTRAVSPDLEISMTTNALGLARTGSVSGNGSTCMPAERAASADTMPSPPPFVTTRRRRPRGSG